MRRITYWRVRFALLFAHRWLNHQACKDRANMLHATRQIRRAWTMTATPELAYWPSALSVDLAGRIERAFG
jgi:hypothetical protein